MDTGPAVSLPWGAGPTSCAGQLCARVLVRRYYGLCFSEPAQGICDHLVAEG